MLSNSTFKTGLNEPKLANNIPRGNFQSIGRQLSNQALYRQEQQEQQQLASNMNHGLIPEKNNNDNPFMKINHTTNYDNEFKKFTKLQSQQSSFNQHGSKSDDVYYNYMSNMNKRQYNNQKMEQFVIDTTNKRKDIYDKQSNSQKLNDLNRQMTMNYQNKMAQNREYIKDYKYRNNGLKVKDTQNEYQSEKDKNTIYDNLNVEELNHADALLNEYARLNTIQYHQHQHHSQLEQNPSTFQNYTLGLRNQYHPHHYQHQHYSSPFVQPNSVITQQPPSINNPIGGYNELKNEQNPEIDLKSFIEKQNLLLENLTKKLETVLPNDEKNSRKLSRSKSPQYQTKYDESNKDDDELKLALLKQQKEIEMLTKGKNPIQDYDNNMLNPQSNMYMQTMNPMRQYPTQMPFNPPNYYSPYG